MKIDVGHVARLANLPLTDMEKKKFDGQLSSILEYVNKLEEVNAGDVEPTSQVTGLENVTRDDVVTPSLLQEEVLKNARLRDKLRRGKTKSTHNGLFKVKAILEE